MPAFELFNHPTYESAFLLEDRPFASGSQTSRVLELGQMNGGIRIRGVFNPDVVAASGDKVAISVQVGDAATGTAWETIYSNTATAGTAGFGGDFAEYIPTTDKAYLKATVTPTPATSGTPTVGTYKVYLDYVPR